MPHLRLHRLLRLQSQHIRSSPITTSAAMRQTGALESYPEELSVRDPDVFWLLRNEKLRQRRSVNLTASENYISKAVMAALASSLSNKYSEFKAGHNGRFYGGNQYVDEVEKLVVKRALKLFELSNERWGVNVHQLSGSAANLAAITGIVQPFQGRIMGLDSGDGGHGTHGYVVDGTKVTATSRFFDTKSYRVDPETSLIDYDGLRETAKQFRPHLIIAGITCYSRHLDYARFRAIADEVGAVLLGDMAHVSGLVSARLTPSPFEHCDVVTTTTHKTLRGPKAGLIFYRKGLRKSDGVEVDLEKKIFDSSYNGCLGDHHNNTLAAVAVALNEAMTPEFQVYQQNILINSRALCAALQAKSYQILTDGTDNHIVIMDLRSVGVHAYDVQQVLEEMGVTVNAVALPWEHRDKMSGLRLGTAALTSRSMSDFDMDIVAEFLHQGIQVAVEIQKTRKSGEDLALKLQEPNIKQRLATLRAQAEFFGENHHLPGDDIL